MNLSADAATPVIAGPELNTELLKVRARLSGGVRPLPAPWSYIIAAALIIGIFIADIILPRGATAAIGYCLIPVLLGGVRPRLLLGSAILCTALTAVGYGWEPPGAERWISIFDRVAVAVVLWLTYVLVDRRAVFTRALTRQAQVLNALTAELRRSNADLEQFASRVAHDLRAPLNSISLLAEFLSHSGSVKADDEAHELVGSIESELKRMNNFIQTLLAYGRAGAHRIRPGDCDCSAVLADVKERLKGELSVVGAEVTSGPLPVLHADPLLMAELLQNLIENSVKYRGQAPPKIRISAAEQVDGSCLFSVQDNGIGIETDECARIFTPFYQLRHGRAASAGVGLGLATCQRIVERHGGRIWVESTPGAGTTFLFTIPTASTANGSPDTLRKRGGA